MLSIFIFHNELFLTTEFTALNKFKMIISN